MAYTTKITCSNSLSIEDMLRFVLVKSGSNYALKIVKI